MSELLDLIRVVPHGPANWLFSYKVEGRVKEGRNYVSLTAKDLMSPEAFEMRCFEALGFWPNSKRLYPATQGWRSYVNQCLDMVGTSK